MKYKYTLLKQDGTREELGLRDEQMNFKEMYEVLNCQTIEIIPQDYYRGTGDLTKVTCYGDEEGRFNENNVTNNHFKTLAPGWDIVGDVLAETEL